MVQKSARAGRPLGFEPWDAIDSAMGLFWERGFEQTSLPDLEERTGLSRSSLYNTFNSKHGLFALVLGRYVGALSEQVLGELETGSDGIEDLHRFIDRLAASLVAPDLVWGCLMVNSLSEFGGRDAEVVRYGRVYLERFRVALSDALARAVSLGEIESGSADARATLLVGLVIGINVIGRSGVGRDVSAALIQAMHAEIAAWSVAGQAL